jgi:hypothetical protein
MFSRHERRATNHREVRCVRPSLNRIGRLRREAARLLGVQSVASLSHRGMPPAAARRHSSAEGNGVCLALADFQLAAALASAGRPFYALTSGELAGFLGFA